jgi:hypothetical protein
MATQQELGVVLGLSQSRVSALVRRGMPTHSAEAAQQWRAINSTEGLGHKGKHKQGTIPAEEVEVTVPPDSDSYDPENTLRRMREIERRVFQQLSKAIEVSKKTGKAEDAAAIQPLTRAYRQAATNSLEAAKSWEKHCRATGQVAPIEHLTNVLESLLEPLASRLRGFAATVAAKANPQAPSVAEAAIAADMEAILNQITAALQPIEPVKAK